MPAKLQTSGTTLFTLERVQTRESFASTLNVFCYLTLYLLRCFTLMVSTAKSYLNCRSLYPVRTVKGGKWKLQCSITREFPTFERNEHEKRCSFIRWKLNRARGSAGQEVKYLLFDAGSREAFTVWNLIASKSRTSW